jgi:DNA invertase Pin-like site-specific DNA recombinase
LISKRTKAALAEAKRRGVQLGNPRIHEARPLALAALRAKRPAPEIMRLMRDWRDQGKTLRAIAEGLNRLNLSPARGRQWYASGVRNQLISAEREHAGNG